MGKNLPPIFKVSNDKIPKDTNKKYTYAARKEQELEQETIIDDASIEEKLDKIFHTKGYSFNIPVEITFAGKQIETFIALRTKDTIITLDNETIPISTITSIQIKKPIK